MDRMGKNKRNLLDRVESILVFPSSSSSSSFVSYTFASSSTSITINSPVRISPPSAKNGGSNSFYRISFFPPFWLIRLSPLAFVFFFPDGENGAREICTILTDLRYRDMHNNSHLRRNSKLFETFPPFPRFACADNCVCATEETLPSLSLSPNGLPNSPYT